MGWPDQEGCHTRKDKAQLGGGSIIAIVGAVIVITLLVSAIGISQNTFSNLPGGTNTTEQPYSYIIFKASNALTAAKNCSNNRIDFVGTNATEVIQDTIEVVNASGNSGTIYVKAGVYELAPLVLPSTPYGYVIQGEMVGTNDPNTGVVFQASDLCINKTMIDLDNSHHVNYTTGFSANIQFKDITFYDGGYAIQTLVNLSQPISQCARFLLRDCCFYSYYNTNCVLDLTNAEDSVMDHCEVSTWYNMTGIRFHTIGGFARIYDCSLGGQTQIGGPQTYIEACVLDSGGINITYGVANNNVQLIGCWIESAGAWCPYIRNYAGTPVILNIVGGRWNSQDGINYTYAYTNSPMYITLSGLTIWSNDNSHCYFFDNTSLADLICVNPTSKPYGPGSIDGCTEVSNATFNAGHFIHSYGSGIIVPNGFLFPALEPIPHGLYSTPSGILVSINNSEGSRVESHVNWANNVNFSIILTNYTTVNVTVSWEAWV